MDFKQLSEAIDIWNWRELLTREYQAMIEFEDNIIINYGCLHVRPTKEIHELILEQARKKIDGYNVKLVDLGVQIPEDPYAPFND